MGIAVELILIVWSSMIIGKNIYANYDMKLNIVYAGREVDS